MGALKAAIAYAKLMDGQDPAFGRQIAFSTVILAAIVCLPFVFADQTLLGLFHISRPPFKIAGGLMALSALGMEIGPLVAGLGEPA